MWENLRWRLSNYFSIDLTNLYQFCFYKFSKLTQNVTKTIDEDRNTYVKSNILLNRNRAISSNKNSSTNMVESKVKRKFHQNINFNSSVDSRFVSEEIKTEQVKSGDNLGFKSSRNKRKTWSETRPMKLLQHKIQQSASVEQRGWGGKKKTKIKPW